MVKRSGGARTEKQREAWRRNRIVLVLGDRQDFDSSTNLQIQQLQSI